MKNQNDHSPSTNPSIKDEILDRYARLQALRLKVEVLKGEIDELKSVIRLLEKFQGMDIDCWLKNERL